NRRKIDVCVESRENPARERPSQGDRCPLFRDWRDRDSEVRPLALVPLLKPPVDPPGVAGSGGDEQMLGRQGNHRAVIEDGAGLSEHQAIAGSTGLESLQVVDVEPIEEFERIGPLNLNLSERGAIEEPGCHAYRKRLAVSGLCARLTDARIRNGTLPAAEVLHDGAVLFMPVVHGEQALRREELPQFASRDRAHGDWCDRRTKRRMTEIASRHPAHLADYL